MTELVAVVERPGLVIHRVAELAQSSAPHIDTGAPASGGLWHAGLGAIPESEKALSSFALVSNLVTVVRGAGTGVGFVAELAEHGAFNATIGRGAATPLRVTTVTCAG